MNKSIQRYNLKGALEAGFLAAMVGDAWGRFCDAAVGNAVVDGISASASVPVGYVVKAAAAEVKLLVDVELSGKPFPFEGGSHNQPDGELAGTIFDQFRSESREPLGEAAQVIQLEELLAVGDGRYNVKIDVTVRLA